MKLNKRENLPLCSFWSKASLIDRFNEIGSRAFNRGFRQKAITSDELTFPHFEDCIIRGEGIPQWQFAFTGVDLSGEKRKGNIIITIGYDATTKILFPIEVRTGNWSSPEMAEQIKDVYNTYKPIIINVENNAYQQALIDWLLTKEYKDIPVNAYTTGKQKSDSEIGLPSLDVQFEKKQWKIYLPDHSVSCICSWCQFEREMKGHPGYVSTDMVMALWFAERAFKKYGIGSGFRGIPEPKKQSGFAGIRNKKW